jgi:hypothetical protein
VPRGRHSLEPTTVPSRRIALVTAPLVTALAVGVGVATSGFGLPESPSSASGNIRGAAEATTDSSAPDSGARTLGTSRSVDRVPLVNHRVPKAKGKLWTTSDLDLRVEPREKSKVAGLLESGKHVAVTGRTQGGYSEVIVGKLTTRWVTADYLSKEKEPAAMGVSDAPCPDGSEIESALQPASVKVYRAVCAAFPELTTYGGQDGHGEHVNGQAIDFMVPDSSTGQRVADFVYANRSEFDLFDIIWSQHIWTIERSGEGFRSMSDRGSATANHYDHVHIMVN